MSAGAAPYVVKPGDRVRSRKHPDVSGIVERVETHPNYGLIYYTANGFWLAKQVTVERRRRSE